jgi:hypothetical protein
MKNSAQTFHDYMTRRSHQMQKHKFGVTCPDVLFMKIALGPPEHEKQHIDIRRHECIGINYVT